MKNIPLIRTALFLLLSMPVVAFAQWQADMVNRITSDTENRYTVHSDLQQYRYDFVDNSKQGAVIVDPAANTSAIMLPDEKKVLYTAADGFISASNDPVQAYNSYRKQGTEKTEGHESIMGYDCVKKSIYDKEGTLMFTTWFSEELNFPLKMMGHWDEFTYMYLENIKGWSPDPAYFKVPKDYSKVDEGANP